MNVNGLKVDITTALNRLERLEEDNLDLRKAKAALSSQVAEHESGDVVMKLRQEIDELRRTDASSQEVIVRQRKALATKINQVETLERQVADLLTERANLVLNANQLEKEIGRLRKREATQGETINAQYKTIKGFRSMTGMEFPHSPKPESKTTDPTILIIALNKPNETKEA